MSPMRKALRDPIGLPCGGRRRRRPRRGVLSTLVVSALVIAPFGAGQAAMSPVAYVMPAEPAPDPGGGADPAPSPPQAELSGPSDGGDSGGGGGGEVSAPAPVQSRLDAQADSGAAGSAQAPPAEPVAESPGAGGTGPGSEQLAVQGPAVAPASPPVGTDQMPQTGAAAPVPAGAPRAAETAQPSVTAPPPGAQPPNAAQPAAVGADQVAPLGVAEQTPTTNAALDGTSPTGTVTAASMPLAPEATQACMGGSGCQAKPMALAADNATAIPPQKEFLPIIGGGIVIGGEGAAVGTAVTGAAAAVGTAVAAAYHWLTSDDPDTLGSLFSSDDEVYNITDPGAPQLPTAASPGNAAQPAPPSTANPGSTTDGGVRAAPQAAAPGITPQAQEGAGAPTDAGSAPVKSPSS